MSHATLPPPWPTACCVVPRNHLIATLTHYELGLSLPRGRVPFESAPMKERRRHHEHVPHWKYRCIVGVALLGIDRVVQAMEFRRDEDAVYEGRDTEGDVGVR